MAAKAKAKKARPKRLKQQRIPGSEPPSIPALDDAAETYYEVMQDRLKLTKEEHEAMDSLVEKMSEHGVERYETADGLVVTITAKSKCKVKKRKDAESNGESNGEE